MPPESGEQHIGLTPAEKRIKREVSLKSMKDVIVYRV
jgi:hypothetical protein